MFRRRRFRRTYIRPTRAALRTALGDAPFVLRVSRDLGGLMTRLAKPMSPAELAVRRWYGANVEPVVRWPGDQVMRGAWKAQQAAAPMTRRLALLRRPREELGPRVELRTRVPYLTAEQRSHISSIVSAKIPASDLVERWDQVGPRVYATWTVRRRPPAKCGYADLDARFDRLAEDEFFLGLGINSVPVTVSFSEDSPHVGLSAGTGAGKSVKAKLLAVQVLARGGNVVILDIKGSHRWARNMPGVEYCTQPEQMHEALIRLAALAHERNDLAFHAGHDWDGPRTIVLAEELNATTRLLKNLWARIRTSSDPKMSPAIEAMQFILLTGRAAKIHVLAIAQMLTALSVGGPEGRENFGIRCLARFTVNAWKMLVPEAAMPRASRVLGRWHVVVGGEVRETQVCFLSDQEAKIFVHKRRPVHMNGAVHVDVPGQGPIKGVPAHVDARASAEITLQDSINEDVCPWTLAATQKRLQRAREAGRPVPTPRGKRQRADLYGRDELISWYESELIDA